MASGFAASALQRRIFLIGPLIALALAGAGPAAERTVATSSPSPSPSAADPLEETKRVLLRAYEAEAVYKVDNLVYAAGVGDELQALKLNEPGVVWGSQVIVQFPNVEAIGAEVVILRAPIPGGGSLCLAEVGEVVDAGLYYARVAAATAKCPPYKPRMPRWNTDQTAGWGG